MKDLQDIQAALQRLTEAQKAQESEASKALMGALRGVEVALTEIIGMREAENEGADDLDEAATVTALGQIVTAIGRLKLEAPTINLEPRFDVPQAPQPAVSCWRWSGPRRRRPQDRRLEAAPASCRVANAESRSMM